MRVLSYNIHKGKAFFSRRENMRGLVDLLTVAKPDIIFLQEFLKDKVAERILEELSGILWPHHSFGKNASSGDFHYGNAILSKYPIRRSENIDISTSKFERRGMLYCQIEPKPGVPVHLFCCHLDLTHWGRKIQLLKMKNEVMRLAPLNETILLAGDFNDWQEKLHLSIQNSFQVNEAACVLYGGLIPSFPSFMPLFSLDRLYFRRITPSYCAYLRSVPWHLRSDHLPFVVDFE